MKNKFIVIYLLNVLDIIFTLFLTKMGFCYEANLIMKPIVNNYFYSFIFKIILPMLLLIFIDFRMVNASFSQLKISKKIANYCIGYYVVINIFHFTWTMVYFYLYKI